MIVQQSQKKKKRWFLRLLLILLVLVVIGGGALFAWNKLVGRQFRILILGLEHTRTDTMMVAFLDTKQSTLDIVSLPRDTYYPVEGYNGLGQKKLNAVFGFEAEGGAERTVKAVEDLLGTTIDAYVTVDYNGVEAIVDRMGGVEIEVPFPMYYVDPYSDPPLEINLAAGLQRLNGAQALSYLRFRQSSDGSFGDGDVGRIGRQQVFVTQMIRQALRLELPAYVAEALPYVDTDIDLATATGLATAMIGFDMNNLKIHTLPASHVGFGDDGLSYFFHDDEATKNLIQNILSHSRK